VKIGVLALQGNYAMHHRVLKKIGIESISIRYPHQLDAVEGLVIPGGESTTMSKLMNRVGFYDPIRSFAVDFPVLGTCAGLILMSNLIIDAEMETLGLLDIKVERNGYGRQIYSETVNIKLKLNNKNYNIPGSFIRAPKIVSFGKSVNVLATRDKTPIIVKNDQHIGITFHPELDEISILHQDAFLRNIN